MLRVRTVAMSAFGFAAGLTLGGCSGAKYCAAGEACDSGSPMTTGQDAAPSTTSDASADRKVDVRTVTPDAGGDVDGGGPRTDAAVDSATDSEDDGAKDGARDGDARSDATDAGPSAAEAGAEAAAPDATHDAVVDTFVCDGSQAPSQAACVLDDRFGLFVATPADGGSDVAGNGTEAAPYATLTMALANLHGLERVYACNGTYDESIGVTAGVSIYGGLTCGVGPSPRAVGPWAYSPATQAVLMGTSPAYALQVVGSPGLVDVEDFVVRAAPGTTTSPTSVAAFVVNSPSVTFRRTTLAAAAGADGAAGAAGAAGSVVSSTVDGTPVVPTTNVGRSTSGGKPGGSLVCTCSNGGVTSGGAGSGELSEAGSAGTPAQANPSPATATGAGSTPAACSASHAAGLQGSNAAAPAFVAVATPVGSIDANGWHPGLASAGVDGNVGQGGGGGAMNNDFPGFVGAGGGCGGCGGLGGAGGASGGGSIALFAYGSGVHLVAATLQAGNGGAGGAGGLGGAGEAGGGNGGGSCGGGSGGHGSGGTGGGGGAGGVSFAALYVGSQPSVDSASTLAAGSAGQGGLGGNDGAADGPSGFSAALENGSAF